MPSEDLTIKELTHQNKNELEKSFEGNDWVLPTDVNLLEPATKALIKKLAEKGWGEDSSEVADIETGFGEALMNAIAHGNFQITKPDGGTETIFQLTKNKQKLFATGKKIFVHLEIDENKASITIRDEGKGFNPDKVANPEVEGLMSESGRGILFMRKVYFDSVKYKYNEEGNEKGMVVTLVKKKKKL